MFFRYQTVRTAAIVLGLGGCGALLFTDGEKPERMVEVAPKRTARPTESKPISVPPIQRAGDKSGVEVPIAAAAPTGDPTLRIIAAIQRPALATKSKDLLGPGTWKVSLYDDDGDMRWDRVKIDKDRDGKPDERWNHKQGRWERDGGAQVLEGIHWRPAGGAGGTAVVKAEAAASDPPLAVAAKAAPAAGKRDPTQAIVAALRRPATGKKQKDLFGGAGPKVNLYDDDGDGRWDRAKVDLDRDDSWDERYTVKGAAIGRKITASGERLVLLNGGWVKGE